MGKNKAGCFFIVEQEVSNQQNRHGCKPVPKMWHATGFVPQFRRNGIPQMGANPCVPTKKESRPIKLIGRLQ